MEQIPRSIILAPVATILLFGVIIVGSYEVAQQMAFQGNMTAVRNFLPVAILAAIAIIILGTISLAVENAD